MKRKEKKSRQSPKSASLIEVNNRASRCGLTATSETVRLTGTGRSRFRYAGRRNAVGGSRLTTAECVVSEACFSLCTSYAHIYSTALKQEQKHFEGEKK